jgi:general stress protein 26
MADDARFAMEATHDAAGNARSRPMVVVRNEAGTLWFFARRDSRKVCELAPDPRVLLASSDERSRTDVSLVGRARLGQGAARAEALWSEPLRTWLPDGPEDPHIARIEVEAQSAECWDSPSSLMAHAYGYVKARLTGEPPAPGDVARVEM